MHIRKKDLGHFTSGSFEMEEHCSTLGSSVVISGVVAVGGGTMANVGEKKKIFVPCENTNQDMDAYGGGYKSINSASSH